MAIYHLSTKPVSRSAGRSSTAAAAYRSCSKVLDERTGELHDYSRKRGLEHAEIVLPSKAAKQDINWARDRQQLWNAAEAAENRKDSRVAREYEVALPHELNKAQRLELVREFSKDLANRYGVAVDAAIHKPHREGDQRNYHAHVLTTTREITATGLGAKTSIELGDKDRAKLGLDNAAAELVRTRERWAEMTNRALERAQSQERVDHRSLADQGIKDREPTKHRGPAITGLLDRGERSYVAERWSQEAALQRLQHAKELGALEREKLEVGKSILDLSGDLVAAMRERDRASGAELQARDAGGRGESPSLGRALQRGAAEVEAGAKRARDMGIEAAEAKSRGAKSHAAAPGEGLEILKPADRLKERVERGAEDKRAEWARERLVRAEQRAAQERQRELERIQEAERERAAAREKGREGPDRDPGRDRGRGR